MSFLQKIDPAELLRLAREPGPKPVDVLNLIQFSNRNQYKIYGLLVSPFLYGVGGSIRWSGKHALAIAGTPPAEDLLVVRYPSIRHFLFMALSPYYMAIANPFRARGVRHFEASFTVPHETGALKSSRTLAGIHFNGGSLPQIKDILESASGKFAYSSREHSPCSFIREFAPTDPNPLAFKETALFSFEGVEAAKRSLSDKVLERIGSATRDFSLQIYEKTPLREYLPGLG